MAIVRITQGEEEGRYNCYIGDNPDDRMQTFGDGNIYLTNVSPRRILDEMGMYAEGRKEAITIKVDAAVHLTPEQRASLDTLSTATKVYASLEGTSRKIIDLVKRGRANLVMFLACLNARA